MKHLLLILLTTCCLLYITRLDTSNPYKVRVSSEVALGIALEAPVKAVETLYTVGNTKVPREVYRAELNCLVEALHFEVRGEPLHGQKLVAQAIMNRVASTKRYLPNTVCKVVNQKIGKSCMFTYKCDGLSDKIITSKMKPKELENYIQLLEIAKAALKNEYKSLTTSVYYKRCDVKNAFFNTLRYRGKVGSHCFFSEHEV